MATYYTFLWTVTLFNLLRCIVQIAQTERSEPVAWNVMWLFTRFGTRSYETIQMLSRQLPLFETL